MTPFTTATALHRAQSHAGVCTLEFCPLPRKAGVIANIKERIASVDNFSCIHAPAPLAGLSDGKIDGLIHVSHFDLMISALPRKIANSGSPWRDLPTFFGNWNSVFKRHRDWVKADVFVRLFDACSDQPDMEYAMVDATIVKVHRHGQGAKEGLRARP
ncbi:hypothetical protein CU102_11610 [Phyllobacterium brassicacearum]|uniref:Insertion element IS402-like domain-containing protein n=1 Tax=Phyllobacterium brassicacearum TaxID=314235 RepID=A0A2P7BR16_9HYPH|nr:hypothetical protein CU102_11610 [Phyllobacterium brassicacearum]TDQ33654.1 putative transposase of IS4/5 family DUF4096 [Phyllobacterium brassicacearum]